MAYPQNGNIMIVTATMIQDTAIAVDSCTQLKRTIQNTVLTLLELSFGDGFSDAISACSG